MADLDVSLLERLRQGDELAFEQLFVRHYGAVYRALYSLTGSREEAEDLAQETFLALYRSAPRPEPGLSLAAWLARVALNRGYNALRGLRRSAARAERAAIHPVPDDPAELAERADERARVRAALASLPERQRSILLLRYAGLSYAEVAAAVGVAPGSVGTLLARAERAFLEAFTANETAPAAGERGVG